MGHEATFLGSTSSATKKRWQCGHFFRMKHRDLWPDIEKVLSWGFSGLARASTDLGVCHALITMVV